MIAVQGEVIETGRDIRSGYNAVAVVPYLRFRADKDGSKQRLWGQSFEDFKAGDRIIAVFGNSGEDLITVHNITQDMNVTATDYQQKQYGAGMIGMSVCLGLLAFIIVRFFLWASLGEGPNLTMTPFNKVIYELVSWGALAVGIYLPWHIWSQGQNKAARVVGEARKHMKRVLVEGYNGL